MKKLLSIALLAAASAAIAGPGLFLLPMKYKGGAVANGGAVGGTVTIDPVPAAAEFDTGGKDAAICKEKQPNHRLTVDAATRGLANVVVYIDGIEEGKAVEEGQTHKIDQHNCQYSPFVSVVPVKSSLTFTSSDPILHNVHMYAGSPDDPHSMKNDVINQAMKDSNSAPVEVDARALRRPGFFYVKCDAGHIWMSAYVWVVEHPYYAVTDAQGKFELKDVPPGKYTLRFWHPGWTSEPEMRDGKIAGYRYGPPVMHSMEIEVKAGETAKADWTCPGK